MNNRPPKLARRFFSWYCKNDLHDSILGDLEERFHQDVEDRGLLAAQLLFWRGVIGFVNRYTLHSEKSPGFQAGLVKSNILGSLRFLQRNRSVTFINGLGLLCALSSLLLTMVFVHHERSFDTFHANADRVHRINFAYEDNAGNVTTLVNSPPALARGIDGKFPEVIRSSRLRYTGNSSFTNGDVRFYEERGFYADSVFLEILKFPLLHGASEHALDMPNSVVISRDLAIKYFDKPDPIGSTLILNNEVPLEVTGVLDALPKNSHIDFDFLISFSTYVVPEGYASDLTSWSWLGFLTYFELAPGTSRSAFELKLANHFRDLDPQNPSPMRPLVQPITDIYLGSTSMADDLASPLRVGNPMAIKAIVFASLLVLLIATFNFSNLMNALSLNRGRSSGVRKVMGANRTAVFYQMMTESMILVTACMLASVVLVITVFDSISAVAGWRFTLESHLIPVMPIWTAIGLLVGFLAGIYPALQMSRMHIVPALKGSIQNPKGGVHIRHVLVFAQFALSICLIATTIVFNLQFNFLKNQQTGYSKENVLLVKLLPQEMAMYYDAFKNELMAHTSVQHVSISDRVVGDPWPFSNIRTTDDPPEESKRVFFNLADQDYFLTMGIPLKTGRYFSGQLKNDSTHAVIVNEKAVDLLGLENPIGAQVHFFELDGPRTIVGVVQDFNYTSLHQEIGPAVVIMPFIDLEHLYVKFASGTPHENVQLLEKTWKHVTGGPPVEWRFLDHNLDKLYRSEERLSSLIWVFCVIALLLSCIGLYGMITFMINTRMKEFGVRKVLGASVGKLYLQCIRSYVAQVLIAAIVVLPFIHLLLGMWLDNFAYKTPVFWWVYPVSALILLVTLLISISRKTLLAARQEPTRLLRDE